MLHFGVPSKGLKRRVESPPFFGVSSGIPKKIGDFESVEWIVQLLSSLWDDLNPRKYSNVCSQLTLQRSYGESMHLRAYRGCPHSSTRPPLEARVWVRFILTVNIIGNPEDQEPYVTFMISLARKSLASPSNTYNCL